ncbi:MAG: M23 family metallopeptidase [Spirochaetaceae bacterium]|jgi:murein DD-endopeptidase MepM/ murein hydrolase activator NlpD|nr:M23 family metallopeptidase [Spirochaetaceae bacterium]
MIDGKIVQQVEKRQRRSSSGAVSSASFSGYGAFDKPLSPLIAGIDQHEVRRKQQRRAPVLQSMGTRPEPNGYVSPRSRKVAAATRARAMANARAAAPVAHPWLASFFRPKMLLITAALAVTVILLRGGVSYEQVFPFGNSLITPTGNSQARGNSSAIDDANSSRNELARYAGVPTSFSGVAGESLSSMQLASVSNPATDKAAQSDEIPLDMAESFKWINYTVKKGDTVSGIAKDFGLSWDAVIAANDLQNVKTLREGQKLRLPNMDGIPYKVVKGDSLEKIAKREGVPMEAILDANDMDSEKILAGASLFIPGAKMQSDALKLAIGELFRKPITGYRLTSNFGWRNDPFTGTRKYHGGLDMAIANGTPVKAASEGKVSATGYNGTYGNYVIISHSSNWQTLYAHLSKISVKEGAAVTSSTKIGEVGSTGYSTGPHLHFAVYKNGKSVNPLDYLAK